jgi:hypothetical protein
MTACSCISNFWSWIESHRSASWSRASKFCIRSLRAGDFPASFFRVEFWSTSQGRIQWINLIPLAEGMFGNLPVSAPKLSVPDYVLLGKPCSRGNNRLKLFHGFQVLSGCWCNLLFCSKWKCCAFDTIRILIEYFLQLALWESLWWSRIQPFLTRQTGIFQILRPWGSLSVRPHTRQNYQQLYISPASLSQTNSPFLSIFSSVFVVHRLAQWSSD